MDMFMDKLAQKLTAQEIIKANAAADAEELSRFKNQVAEYEACLERFKGLLDQGEGKWKRLQEDKASDECLIEESLKGIREALDMLEKSVQDMQDGRNAADALLDEAIHRECVKVYRNVQAVMAEESGKQTKAAQEAKDAAAELTKKAGAILKVSLAALIFALTGVVIQVLNMWF